MTKNTVFNRYITRVRRAGSSMHPTDHVHAELDRLTRQIRQLPTTRGMYYDQARSVKLKDVLALLREAKK